MEGQSGPCRGPGAVQRPPTSATRRSPGPPLLPPLLPRGSCGISRSPQVWPRGAWRAGQGTRPPASLLREPAAGPAEPTARPLRLVLGQAQLPSDRWAFLGGPGRPHSGAPGKALVRGLHGHPGPAPGRRGPSGTDGASSCRGLARPRLAPRLSPGPRGLCPPPHPMPSPVLPSRTQVPRYPFGQTGISPPLGSPLRLLPAERLPELPLPALWCLPAPPPPADS